MRPASDLSPLGERLAGLRQETPTAGGLRTVTFSQAAPAPPPPALGVGWLR